jgi:hypothetical protein
MIMRFTLGPPPSSCTVGPAWTALKEPGPWAMQAVAVPVGAALAVAALGGWVCIAPVSLPRSEGTLVLIGWLCVLIPAHEWLHAVAHPSFGLTPQTVVGFWPSRLLFFAHYDGCLSRNRLILVFLLPTLVLTLLPVLLATVWRIHSDWFVFVSSLNALIAGVDVCSVLLLISQVPVSARVQNEGYKTYWQQYPAEV